ncbi:MAG: hypothetical protein M4579_000351 [Chaenotheca gracillima]|nr:MAG: hypothetical protein M4579_000351 [Chaenotheca gracillima]
MCILHLRWAGRASVGITDGTARRFWSQIRRLEICMTNPVNWMNLVQEKMGSQVLHDYLASFCDTLKELVWRWEGERGPNAMFSPGMVRVQDNGPRLNQQINKFRALRTAELLGSFVTVLQVAWTFMVLAPSLRVLDVEADHFEEQEARLREHLDPIDVQWAPMGDGKRVLWRFWKRPQHLMSQGLNHAL